MIFEFNVNSLFIFLLFLLSNLLASIINPSFRNMVSKPSYVRHVMAVILMYFAVTVTGTYGAMSAGHILVSAIGLYAIFATMMTMTRWLIFVVIVLLFLTYMLETQKQYVKANAKDRDRQTVGYTRGLRNLVHVQIALFAMILALFLYHIVRVLLSSAFELRF